jgi:hypothetical protein
MMFKVGDRVRMMETCGDQLKGTILIVQNHPDGGGLYVKADNQPVEKRFNKSGTTCGCSDSNWALVSHGTVDDWQKELEN